MSCLNLHFPPAKKAWRNLTSKLQKHLHKLNKSKNIKKTRHQFDQFPSTSTKSVALHHSSVLFSHNKKKNRLFNPFKPKKNKQSLFSVKKRKKKTAPVYIDNLFIGPVTQEVVVKCPTRAKTMKVREIAEKQEGEGSERNRQADTMWESLGLGSPLMEGIDERAERFIASFRAEMEVQEIIDSQCNDDDSS